MSRGTIFTFAVAALAAFGSTTHVAAEDFIVVWLNDGRMLVGDVDPRTDDDSLWLQTTGTGFVVATSAKWSNIKAVNANGEQMKVNVFKPKAAEFINDEAPVQASDFATDAANAATTTSVARPRFRSNEATRVASLDVEARVANWDRDAETDGIEIRVLPRNTFGEVIPASGQITATMIGRNQLPTHDPQAFPQLGRWSLRADTSDFGGLGAIYRLPFRGKHPDREFSLEPHGLVEVSFFIHGQGRFTADAPTYLYRFNPVRRDMIRQPTNRIR